jgi:hypothetical protein
MQFMVLIYGKESEWDAMNEAENKAVMEEYIAFTQETRDKGVFVAGDELKPTSTATTVRIRDGKTMVTDGPFAETHEQLGGYYLLECKDLDEAIAYAAKIPAVRSGSIEVRPVMTYD